MYPPKTSWGDELIEQMISFPNGKYDDKVDVCGLFGRILDQTYAPSTYKEDKEIRRDSWGNEYEHTDDWALM